ncbi:MAG: hypothetical protein GX128_08045 [Bacteroidales bacterium]|jgi:hypothetical protein|nr:hypothetical protein [Bacteroidales bacterium]
MITSLIGRTFLQAYNEKYKTSYSSKQFFEEVYFELFFNHPKYMQWVTNSAFVQMKSGQKPELLSHEERLEKLHSLYQKVENEQPDASFAIGYPAADDQSFATTSGLVSDIVIQTNEEEIYNSWIGSGLGIGVAGGYSFLINDPVILLKTFEGWSIYRKYLNDKTLENIRGNQINTWNGQWLTFRLGKNFREEFVFRDLEQEGFFKIDDKLIEVNTVKWTNLFFSLSRNYPTQILNSYIYSLGQTNKTIGFIPVYLSSGKKLIDVWRKLYDSDSTFDSHAFQSLFGMEIKRACELGSIGLLALRPQNLRKYFHNDKSLNFKKEKEIIMYKSFKIWLIAMLSKNKEEITDYTLEIANLLLRYRAGDSKTTRKNLIDKDLLAASSKKAFLDALAVIVKDINDSDIEAIKTLRNEVHLMTNEEFTYFNTLLKFDYNYTERN